MTKEEDSKSTLKFYVDFIDKKLDFFTRNVMISLLIITAFAFMFRLLFFVSDIPIRQDALGYFWYANDMSIVKSFIPISHTNNGWSIFLSIFFSIFHFNNFMDYTILQRYVAITLSVLTIIPVYFLCRKFFDRSYSLVGVALFEFEPHIIQNSMLGLTEPLYIFLGIGAIVLFFNTKTINLSFGIAALCTLVRAEGIVLLPIFSIMFFALYRTERKFLIRYLFAASIFGIILLFMAIINFQTSGGDGTTGHIMEMTYGTILEPEKNLITFSNFTNVIETLAKRLGQSMIPYFALFVPFGSILIFKNRNHQMTFVILTIIIYLVVATRIFFVASDLRYILFLYPLFAILSVFAIKHLGDPLTNRNTFLVLIIGSIMLLSWFFLYNNNNNEYEKEALRFAAYLVGNVKVVNNYYPESGYIYAAWASTHLTFPILSSSVTYTGPEALDYIKNTFDYLEKNANSVEEYIELARNQGLTHLVLDGNKKRAFYFNDAFYNEAKYTYLIKEFDSKEHGYKYYHVKVFKIDYSRFDSMKNSK